MVKKCLFTGLFFLFCLIVASHRQPALAQNAPGETLPPPLPQWLEPRGLHAADLVGQVDDKLLQGAIIMYATNRGMLTYQSGALISNTVVITASVTPRYTEHAEQTYTTIGCLGVPAVYDQWPSTVPASILRLFEDGQEITDQIEGIAVAPAGRIWPTHNSFDYYRYPEQHSPLSVGAEGLAIPANMGCTITLTGKHSNLTARFTLNVPRQVKVTHLGGESFSAHSYIGVGSAGILTSLSAQMDQRFGTRHDKFRLSPPTGAEYALVRFPPTPVDPYADDSEGNRPIPGSGTYRFHIAGGFLSSDHVASMGLSLFGQWLDADLAANAEYLPYLTNTTRLASMEYFVPPGIDYDPCMTNGGCPDPLLNQIYTTTYTMTIDYYQVERVVATGLERFPLRMVGPVWTAGAPAIIHRASEIITPTEAISMSLYLPIVVGMSTTPPPDDRTGCPCGWFDTLGRMVDFIQRPD